MMKVMKTIIEYRVYLLLLYWIFILVYFLKWWEDKPRIVFVFLTIFILAILPREDLSDKKDDE